MTKSILGPVTGALALLVFAASCVAPAPAPKREGAERVPDVSLVAIDGSTLRFDDPPHRLLLVNFWATWCAPCREEIPDFNRLLAAYRDRGLRIVGISMDEEGEEVVKPFVAEFEMTYPVAIGDDALAEAFGGLPGFPTTFLVDAEGTIVDKWFGAIPRKILEEKIRGRLES